MALELYSDSNNQNYPVATTNTAADCTATLAHGLQQLTTVYIPVVPRDPNRTGNDACYFYATQTVSGTTARYHIAATIEDAVNNATLMGGDRDCESNIAGNCATGVGYTAGFDAAGAATCGDIVAGTDACYDVAN